MQQSVVLSIGLPVALVIIMLGLGLSLRIEDFTRCLSRPWPILVGLVCQVVILPLFCLALVYIADLPPAISVGMMLLAASPGGTSAAIYTHLARGDLALSLILAAVTSVTALLSLPVIVNLSMVAFYGEASAVIGWKHVRCCRYSSARYDRRLWSGPSCVCAKSHWSLAQRLDRPVENNGDRLRRIDGRAGCTRRAVAIAGGVESADRRHDGAGVQYRQPFGGTLGARSVLEVERARRSPWRSVDRVSTTPRIDHRACPR